MPALAFIRTIGLFILLTCITQVLAAQEYKRMMQDPQYNLYEVIEAAETYFSTIDRYAKGSGWKQFERWRARNEPFFYPSGDRSKFNPYAWQAEARKLRKQFSYRDGLENPWKELGPYFIENVSDHYSLGLGRVESFYYEPKYPNRIYLGSRSGGFWKSMDAGATWVGGSTDTLPASGVNTIAVDPYNPDHILINVRNANNGVTHGIYRSMDAGDTWEQTNFNPTNLGWGGLGTFDRVYHVKFHPRDSNRIYIVSSEGIFVSNDNLQTWTQSVVDVNCFDLVFHPTRPDTMYSSRYYDYENILVSYDGGSSFNNSAPLTGNSTFITISTTSDCPDCIYVASSAGIWKSETVGQEMSLLSTPGIDNYGGFCVNDLDQNMMLLGDIDAHVSVDQGHTFRHATTWNHGTRDYLLYDDYVHADIRGARSINGNFWVNTDGFLAYSNDGGISWDRFEGQSIRENYRAGVSQSNHARSICGSQDNGTSIKSDTGWIEFYGADGMDGIIHPLNDDWMIGSIQFGVRIKTTTGGWDRTNPNPWNASNGAWIAPIRFDPNDQLKVYDFRADFFTSPDFGESWDEGRSTGLNSSCRLAAIAENNSDNILVGSYESLNFSNDGGNSFRSISQNMPTTNCYSAVFDPNDDNTIVAVYSDYLDDGKKIYVTHDQGSSWENISYNLSALPIYAIAITEEPNPTYYVGTEIGVYYKKVDETIWQPFNKDLPNVAVLDLKIIHATNTLRAATWGRGLWEVSLANKADFPKIVHTRIDDQPTPISPPKDVDQFVTSRISYADSLTSVFVRWSTDLPTFDQMIPMEHVSDSTWRSSSAIPATESKIFFKVFAVGSNLDTTITYKFMYRHFNQKYCKSYASMDYATAITYLSLSDLEHESEKSAPYTDYTATDSATVHREEMYELNLRLNTDGNYPIHGAVWVDWNQDGSFTGTNEFYNLGLAQNVEDGPTSSSPLSIIIPKDAELGKTVMRVSAKYDQVPGPCDVQFDGEVEDYTVVVKKAVGINQQFERALTVAPNPSSGRFFVDLGKSYRSVEFQVTDAQGRRVLDGNIQNTDQLELEIKGNTGNYLLHLVADDAQANIKLSKQ